MACVSSVAALILVGGHGTRLRPLTFTRVKPLVPFMNVPMIVHQLAALRAAGVTRVTLALARASEGVLVEGVGVWAERLGMTMATFAEDTPLGTGGATCAGLLAMGAADNTVVVMNSDVYFSEFNIRGVIDAHAAARVTGAIQTARVADPSRFGVVESDDDGMVCSFEEKPSRPRVHQYGVMLQPHQPGHPHAHASERAPVEVAWVNAGIYCFTRDRILDVISKCVPSFEAGTTVFSIERSVFPVLAHSGQLVEVKNMSRWVDLGTSDALLSESVAVLRGGLLTDDSEAVMLAGSRVVWWSSLVSALSTVQGSASLSVVGARCVVGPGATLLRCVLLDGAVVEAGARVTDTIVGADARVGENAVLAGCVIGDGAVIDGGTTHDRVRYAPHITVSRSTHAKPGGPIRDIFF